MGKLPLLALPALIFAAGQAAAERGVYGADDRRDLYQVSDPGSLRLAEASVSLFPETYVDFSPDGRTARLFTEPYAKAYKVCPQDGCEGEDVSLPPRSF